MHKPFIIFIFVFINCVICNEITPISPKNWAKPYSPFYDAACNRLLMVDFANGTLINYNLKSQIIYESRIPGISNPSFMIPIKCRKNKFLVSNGLSTAIIKWNGVEPEAQVVETLFSVETSQEFINNNWNQASVSPQFRFYGGTYRRGMCGDMPPTTGAVYRYDKCKSVKKITPNVKVTGGIEWNAKGDTMYFVDPCQKVIWAYDYIKNTGAIKNGRIVFVYQGGFGDANTIPLGLAIDRKEYLYVTLYGGGAVLKVDPRTGHIVDVIYVPAEIVSDVTFGGDNNDILFITTFNSARNIQTGENSNKTFSPHSGQVFMKMGMNAKGIRSRSVRL